jgi:hypothetical protein
MAIKVHNSKWLLLALLALAPTSGCFCLALPLPGENECPTDARRLYCTCGEEAVRRCPCGPDREFYGLKPTCWREWPEGWQCNGCEGFPYVDRDLSGVPVTEAPMVAAPSHEDANLSNPFRAKPGAAELPLPPKTPEFAPTQSAPAKPAPVQLIPAEPTPTAPPALEKTPMETPPPKDAPAEPAPADKKPTTETPAEKATSAVVAPQKTPEAASPAAPTKQVEAIAPLPMPIVPAAMKMTAAAPALIAPQNAPTIVTVATPNPKPVQVAAVPKLEKQQMQKKSEASTAKDSAEDPALSKRVEQHLLNNLRL